MLCDLVRATTADGLRLDGALHAPDPSSTLRLRTDLVLCLHGVAGNFYTGTLFEEILPLLLAQGAAVLRVNTRGHDGLFTAPSNKHRRYFGAAYEVVDECRLDIAAWLALAHDRGYQRVAIFGHSLGAVKAVYALAHCPELRPAALIAASPPRLSGTHYLASCDRERFEPLLTQAERFVAEGHPEQLMEVRFPSPLLISAGTYVDKYGRENRYNVLQHATRVTVPTLYAYGELELDASRSAFAGMPEALAALPWPGKPAAVAIIQHADHMYTGVRRELGAAVLRFLA